MHNSNIDRTSYYSLTRNIYYKSCVPIASVFHKKSKKAPAPVQGENCDSSKGEGMCYAAPTCTYTSDFPVPSNNLYVRPESPAEDVEYVASSGGVSGSAYPAKGASYLPPRNNDGES